MTAGTTMIDTKHVNINMAGYMSFYNPDKEDFWITEDAKPRSLLESYYYFDERWLGPIGERVARGDWTMILDSGAFSAWSKGGVIDLQEYMTFIKTHRETFHLAAALDVIGDADASWRNYEVMRDAGLEVMPCFHYGEPWEFLDKLVESAPYIAIGGVVGIAGDALIEWLDSVWGNHLTNPDGSAKVKVHGFAVTSTKAMLRYPWESVDSTSWLRQAAYGRILVDMPGREGAAFSLPLSDESPEKEGHDKHYDSMNPVMKEELRAYIEDVRGYKLQDLKDKYRWRQHWNINYFKRAEPLGAARFIREQPGLFF